MNVAVMVTSAGSHISEVAEQRDCSIASEAVAHRAAVLGSRADTSSSAYWASDSGQHRPSSLASESRRGYFVASASLPGRSL